MKAFKQLNFRRELKLVWGYSAALIIIGVLIMVRPVLAQDEKSVPEVKIDVQKKFDEQGNLIGMDSVRTWTWSGDHFSQEEFDSVWRDFHSRFDHLMKENFNGYSFNDLPDMHNFWLWNGEDSTAYSHFDRLDEFLNEDFKEYMKEFEERLEAYQREHQQLIEKYFSHPLKGDDKPDATPNKYVPEPAPQQNKQSGKV